MLASSIVFFVAVCLCAGQTPAPAAPKAAAPKAAAPQTPAPKPAAPKPAAPKTPAPKPPAPKPAAPKTPAPPKPAAPTTPGVPSPTVSYRSADADFMVGAILPLTKPGCTEINPEGAALAEAIVHGIETIRSESDFADLIKAGTVGYDIRDNCGQSDETRAHAHTISSEALDFKKGKSTKKPVDVVISAFTDKDISALLALHGDEILAALSYAPDNARLTATPGNEKKIAKLVSAYPEQTKKISAIADIVEEFGFKYVFSAVDNDAAEAKLESELESSGVCMEALSGSVGDMVKAISAKPLVNVLVVDLPDAEELKLYQELENNNITDLTVITTDKFDKVSVAELKDVPSVVDGGMSVFYKRDSKNIIKHMRNIPLPYTDREWLQAAFKAYGGADSCLTAAGKSDTSCSAAKEKVRDALLASVPISEYAFQGVVAMAYAQIQAMKSGEAFLDAVKGLDMNAATLQVKYSEEMSATIGEFIINNIRLVGGKLDSKFVGNYDDTNPRALNMRKAVIIWTEGSKDTPTSVCNSACAPGSFRIFAAGQGKCCWDCDKCPNGTVSNTSNAVSCTTCADGTVVRPDQSGCKAYTLVYFEWFGGPGAVVIVLMIIGVALVLFGLGVFSQNTHHEVVINANYNSLCVFLLALILLIFCPVPLLVKPPSGGSCSAYILMFNLGVSIVLGVLTSRSAWVNGLFDESGQLSKGTLGRFPRTTIVVGVVVIQFILLIIVLGMESPLTIHNLTEQWDERYHECSSWASSAFWAGFTWNIIVSVIGNSLSCSSLDMAENVAELKYVLIGFLMWYMWGLVELCVFFRSNDEALAGGQAVIAVLFAITLFFVYPWPKMYAILFRSKGGKLLPEEEEEEEEEGMITEASAVSSKAGLTGQGIVSVKIREADDDE